MVSEPPDKIVSLFLRCWKIVSRDETFAVRVVEDNSVWARSWHSTNCVAQDGLLAGRCEQFRKRRLDRTGEAKNAAARAVEVQFDQVIRRWTIESLCANGATVRLLGTHYDGSLVDRDSVSQLLLSSA